MEGQRTTLGRSVRELLANFNKHFSNNPHCILGRLETKRHRRCQERIPSEVTSKEIKKYTTTKVLILSGQIIRDD